MEYVFPVVEVTGGLIDVTRFTSRRYRETVTAELGISIKGRKNFDINPLLSCDRILESLSIYNSQKGYNTHLTDGTCLTIAYNSGMLRDKYFKDLSDPEIPKFIATAFNELSTAIPKVLKTLGVKCEGYEKRLAEFPSGREI